MRSDEILTAFADTLFAQQEDQPNHDFVEMPGHPRTCWPCNRPKRIHRQVADTRERGPVVALELRDLLDPAAGNATGAAYDGPPRCARKHAP